MKKITKLINGSIVVFVICLIAVLTLTSCDNTNSGDNLRKGQDTNITEVQGDEYQVTEKEFNEALNIDNYNDFKIVMQRITADVNENSVIEVTNDVYSYYVEEELIQTGKKNDLKNITGNLNIDKSYLNYNKTTKTYDTEILTANKIDDKYPDNIYIQMSFKFQDKKLNIIEQKQYYTDDFAAPNVYMIMTFIYNEK